MKTHIDKIMQFTSIIFFALTFFGGLIYFFNSAKNYFEYHDFIDGASVFGGSSLASYTDYGNIAYSGKVGMIYSIAIIVSGFLVSILLYSIAKIIELLSAIHNRINNSEIKPDNTDVSNSKLDLLSLNSNVSSSEWECKKCGTKNPNNKNFCKDCGAYK